MSGAKKQFSFLSTDETSGITFSVKIEFYSQVKLLAHIFSSLLHKFLVKDFTTANDVCLETTANDP